MTEISPLTPTSQALFAAFGFKDMNGNNIIEANVPGEGYNRCKECDANGDKMITTDEAWAQYYNNISSYPHITRSLKAHSDFRDPFEASKEIMDYVNKYIMPLRQMKYPSDRLIAQMIFINILSKEKMDFREDRKAGGGNSVRDTLERIEDKLDYGKKKDETAETEKKWKMPWKWKTNIKKASKSLDKVLVLYLNIKGELETPMVQPLYQGNMVIIRNKPYEVDPRAFWTVKIGFKQYKVLIIKEIDRRPVSNLDYSEIKRRGDATDSDEFLIKAAMKAQQTQVTKGMGKIAIVIIILVVIGALAYFFFKG